MARNPQRLVVLAFACLVCGRLALEAQGVLHPPAARPPSTRGEARPDTYGVTDTSTYTIWAFDFEAWDSLTTFDAVGGSRFLTSGGPLEAAVQLPAGAVITAIELQACDSLATDLVDVKLYSAGFTAGAESSALLANLTTGAADVPGCAFFSSSVSPAVIVDNFNKVYGVEVTTTGGNSGARFMAVRLSYHLQVSPAPGTATFGDVPVGHPQHRFVEALVAAGITAGCTGGNYCPNDPITRGQMAVFLSVALGLHFAP